MRPKKEGDQLQEEVLCEFQQEELIEETEKERKNRPVKFKKAVSFRNKTKNKQINNNNNKKRKTEKVKEYLECLPKES